MAATITQIHPRQPLALDELLAHAADIAAGASVPAEDEIYRRAVLARLGGACCEVTDLTSHRND